MKAKLIFFLLLSPCVLFAQSNTNFTQFFINPYLYNPSYAGADAQGAVFLSYRNQWTGFEGAPSIGNFSFHTPAGKNVGFGINFSNEQKSVLQTSSAMLSLSYALTLGEHSFLRFGMSAGGAFSGVDMAEFEEDAADPAYADILENQIYLIGNAGVSLQLKTFNLGISSPNIFTEQYVTTEGFSLGEVAPMENIIISGSNRFYFAKGKHVFEPIVLYRFSDVLPSQLEAAGIIHLNHTVWFGGSYKQDFGISALGGLKLKQKFAVGYSYSLASSGLNEINSPTHEIHLSLLVGKKHKERIAYSFVHTEKEKKKKPTRPTVAKQEPAKEEPKVEVEPKPEATAWSYEKENEAVERINENGEKERGIKFDRINEKGEKEVVFSWLPPPPPGSEEETYEIANPNDEPLIRTKPDGTREAGIAWIRTIDGVKQDTVIIWGKIMSEEEANEIDHNPSEAMSLDAAKITIKADKPVEQEAEPTQTTETPVEPERAVVVKRGNHLLELEEGEYVVVGAFSVYENAEKYSDQLFAKGYPTRFGYTTEKGLWYVYLFRSDDIAEARSERNKARQNKLFPKAWVLTVE